MNGIVIDIDPVFLRIGRFELHWYSLAIIAAIAAAIAIVLHQARKKGIPSSEIYSIALWSVIAGILGARAFHVIDHFDYYLSNPSQILQFQGLAIWGGLVTGVVTGAVCAWLKHMPLGRLFDIVVPALLVAQIIGRFGCIVNGDAYGGVTDLPWGFIYTNPNALIPSHLLGVPTHPYPVYEILWNGASLLLLLKLRRYFKVDGLVFVSYVGLYSVGRLLLTLVREETQVLWGLQQAQVLALAGMIIAAGVFAYLQVRGRRGGVVEGETVSG
ncbi:MAG: prolipoprotein diacylglyceryl transferase [Dehalococcoidia bacterium]|nr:prolipoprotein diacylglyceryl transferase [Dehalococcoidia bacterium]